MKKMPHFNFIITTLYTILENILKFISFEETL